MSTPVPCRVREAVFLTEEESRQLSSNGYVQRSAAQWSEGITRYRQSGMGSRDFCAADGLVPRTVEKWERRLRRKEGTKGKVIAVPAPLGVSGPWAVEVEFPHGVRLRGRG
jgi:hypothetical protein